MYIGLDFDGTVVDHRYPDIGEPAPRAIKWLKRLQQSGGKIILFTMRSNNNETGNLLNEAVQFLEKKLSIRKSPSPSPIIFIKQLRSFLQKRPARA